jgi:hypothetical protein
MRRLLFQKRFFSDGRALQNSFIRSVKSNESTTSNILEHPVAFPSRAAGQNIPTESQPNNNRSDHTFKPTGSPSYSTITESLPSHLTPTFVHDNLPQDTTTQNLIHFSPKIKGLTSSSFIFLVLFKIVIGIGGGGCNAVNNMIQRELVGVDFICANTDAQHLSRTLTENRIQLGRVLTKGLGCGANPNEGWVYLSSYLLLIFPVFNLLDETQLKRVEMKY